MARRVPAPRAVVVARWASAVAAGAAVVYLMAAIPELRRLAGAVNDDVVSDFTYAIHGVEEHVMSTAILCGAVVATTGPLALFTPRMGPRIRLAAIITCLVVLAAAPLIMAVDVPTVLDTTFLRDDYFSRVAFTPWYPIVYYFAMIAILVGSVAALVGLASSDAREYFRRHREVAENDPRIWSVSRARRPD